MTGLPTTPDRSVEVRQPSTAWIFREVVPTGTWTPERQGLADATDLALSEGRVDMSTANRFGALYFASNHPLATATRRFEVRCGQPPAYPGNFERRDL